MLVAGNRTERLMHPNPAPTGCVTAESEEELKSLLMQVKERVKKLT